MNFIDEVEIDVASGKGGPGRVSFRRESMLPRGGPDGGDGGRGGHVIVRATKRLNTLLEYRYKKSYRAPDGEGGGMSQRTGADGEDLILDVPVGTRVLSDLGEVVKDFTQEEEILLCRGGKGGKGNTFYKSSVNQAPTIAQKGLPGEVHHVKLELKLLADIGIIGLPNAGKSTLISRLSAAKPKIADYPFTTLVPNLGVAKLHGDRTCVLADIPGLVPGAHEGVGLGIQFLKHIERTRAFIHLIAAGPMQTVEPLEAYQQINSELLAYDQQHLHDPQFEPLAKRPQIVVINKTDLLSATEKEKIRSEFEASGLGVLFISAVSGHGLSDLVIRMERELF